MSVWYFTHSFSVWETQRADNSPAYDSHARKRVCVAVCCSVLQCVAVCCSHFSTPRHMTRMHAIRILNRQNKSVCCSVLQFVAVCCRVLQSLFNSPAHDSHARHSYFWVKCLPTPFNTAISLIPRICRDLLNSLPQPNGPSGLPRINQPPSTAGEGVVGLACAFVAMLQCVAVCCSVFYHCWRGSGVTSM